jgi:hypothetical protein
LWRRFALIFVDHDIGVVGLTVAVAHIWPFFDCFRCEADGSAAEAVGPPAVEGHEVAALGIVGHHVSGFEAPGRAETVADIPPCAELPEAIGPAAIEEHALAHLSLIYIKSFYFWVKQIIQERQIRNNLLSVAKFRCKFDVPLLVPLQNILEGTQDSGETLRVDEVQSDIGDCLHAGLARQMLQQGNLAEIIASLISVH